MTLHRRTMLAGLAALAGASGAWNSAVASGSGADTLTLVLRFRDGSLLRFDQQQAQDAGDYVGAFVHQKCFVQRQDVWTVFFRPDADGTRQEIVVERGRIWLKPGEAASHSNGYTAEIAKDGAVIARIDVPVHWWGARWRWQSKTRPVIRSAAEIFAGRLVPPFGKGGLYGAPPLSGRDHSFTGPMSYGPIQPNMPNPGERPDIGIIPEPHALYLSYDTPRDDVDALSHVLSWGEGAAAIAIHFRDEKTNATLDWYKYPHAAWGASDVAIPRPPDGANHPAAKGHWVHYDSPHAPAPAYLPYLLTDDPYFLEEMEATVAGAVLWTGYHRDIFGLPGLVYPGETRAWAWGVRSVFQIALVAPEKPPSWLKPRDFWMRTAGDNLGYARRYMESKNVAQTVFRAMPGITLGEVWMQNMILLVCSWAAWTEKFDKGWNDFIDWEADMQIKMTDGKSGWDRRWPVPYLFVVVPKLLGQGICCIFDGRFNGSSPSTWSEIFQVTLQEMRAYYTKTYGSKFNPATLDPSKWDDKLQCWNPKLGVPPAYSSGDYALFLRGALAMAVRAGIGRARPSYDFIAGKMPELLAGYGGEHGMARWAVEPS